MKSKPRYEPKWIQVLVSIDRPYENVFRSNPRHYSFIEPGRFACKQAWGLWFEFDTLEEALACNRAPLASLTLSEEHRDYLRDQIERLRSSAEWKRRFNDMTEADEARFAREVAELEVLLGDFESTLI